MSNIDWNRRWFATGRDKDAPLKSLETVMNANRESKSYNEHGHLINTGLLDSEWPCFRNQMSIDPSYPMQTIEQRLDNSLENQYDEMEDNINVAADMLAAGAEMFAEIGMPDVSVVIVDEINKRER